MRVVRVIIGALCCLGATSFAQDRDFGRAMSFDGVQDEITSFADFDTKRLTVEAWVNVTYMSNGSCGVAAWGRNSDAAWELAVTERHVDFAINWNKGAERRMRAKGVFHTGSWIHLAATYDGRFAKLYVNGELAGEEEFATRIEPAGSGARFALNNQFPGVNEFGFAELDEVRVWNVARSAAEIRCTMHREIDPNSNGLMAYYRFDDTELPQIVVDHTKYSRHAYMGYSERVGSDDPTAVVSTAPFQCLSLVKQAEPKIAGVSCGTEFEFEVCGESVITYQWFKGDEIITGANASKLSIDAVTPADQGTYTCVAFGSCGILMSDIVRLDVCVADFDCSGGVDADDTIAFQSAWASGEPRADLDGSGEFDAGDIVAFFERLDQGC
jgi:hypothetical protein